MRMGSASRGRPGRPSPRPALLLRPAALVAGVGLRRPGCAPPGAAASRPSGRLCCQQVGIPVGRCHGLASVRPPCAVTGPNAPRQPWREPHRESPEGLNPTGSHACCRIVPAPPLAELATASLFRCRTGNDLRPMRGRQGPVSGLGHLPPLRLVASGATRRDTRNPFAPGIALTVAAAFWYPSAHADGDSRNGSISGRGRAEVRPGSRGRV